MSELISSVLGPVLVSAYMTVSASVQVKSDVIDLYKVPLLLPKLNWDYSMDK